MEDQSSQVGGKEGGSGEGGDWEGFEWIAYTKGEVSPCTSTPSTETR